jgi:hypothetical protein
MVAEHRTWAKLDTHRVAEEIAEPAPTVATRQQATITPR